MPSVFAFPRLDRSMELKKYMKKIIVMMMQLERRIRIWVKKVHIIFFGLQLRN
jgi:hypothetical protein